MTLVKRLISAGVDVNAKEMCGATPLTIAVVNKNEELAQLLVQNFANFDSRYFATIPNPVTIAKKNGHGYCQYNSEILQIFHCAEQLSQVEISASEKWNSTDEDEMHKHTRTNKSCITLIVSNQGRNKIIRGVKGRSEAAYGWCAEAARDMHAKGYVYEVYKKVMPPGGFMHILQNVFAKKKSTNKCFGKKVSGTKPQHNRRGCVRHCCCIWDCICAAVQKLNKFGVMTVRNIEKRKRKQSKRLIAVRNISNK